MKEQEEIIKRLDKIVFHDVPVEKISFKTEYSTDFTIDFALYREDKKSYDYWVINFIGIEKLKTNSLELNSDSDLEIYSFDYELKELFECKILFLLGFGQPSLEVKLNCKTIELNKTSRCPV
jgi:hypothetical protein